MVICSLEIFLRMKDFERTFKLKGVYLMFKTRFTELIGIEHPIMQGGMQHLGVPQLAAAVSNAGGLGTINITIYPEMDDFRAAVKKTKELTDKPFAVNISLAPGLNMGEKSTSILMCAEKKA